MAVGRISLTSCGTGRENVAAWKREDVDGCGREVEAGMIPVNPVARPTGGRRELELE